MKRRRKRARRAGFAVCLLAGILVFCFAPTGSVWRVWENITQIQDSLPDRAPIRAVIVSAASSTDLDKRYTVFSTKDYVVKVNHITTEEMNVMLGDVPHGIYTTQTGELRFWSTALAVGSAH